MSSTADALDRSFMLGGSDAAAVLGVSPWKTRLQLYLEKVGEAQEDVTPQRQAIFDRGHRLEPYIREWARQDFGLEIITANARYTHPNYPFLSCEIDFEWNDDRNVVANADVKSVNWRAAKEWGEPGTDEVPVYYTSQFLFGQALTGRDLTLCVAMLGMDDLRPYRIRYDEELAQHIVDNCVAFWEQHVLPRVPPEPTSLEDVKLLYRRDNGSPIEATREIAEMVEELRLRKKALAGDEAKADLLELQIKRFMRDHTELVSGDGKKVATWKAQEKKSFTVQASSSRVFRLHGGSE